MFVASCVGSGLCDELTTHHAFGRVISGVCASIVRRARPEMDCWGEGERKKEEKEIVPRTNYPATRRHTPEEWDTTHHGSTQHGVTFTAIPTGRHERFLLRQRCNFK